MDNFLITIEYSHKEKTEYLTKVLSVGNENELRECFEYLQSHQNDPNILITSIWTRKDVEFYEMEWSYNIHCVISPDVFRFEKNEMITLRKMEIQNPQKCWVYILPPDGNNEEWPGYNSVNPAISSVDEKVWVYSGQGIDLFLRNTIEMDLALQGLRFFLETSNPKFESIRWEKAE